jgi:hypothetical protein
LLPKNKVEPERTGFLLSINSQYMPLDHIRFDLDLAYYNSDDYYSGIWLLNYFAPGATQITALYNQGYRLSLITKLEINNKINIYLAYRINHQLNTNTIGSAYDLINSNSEQRILLQGEWILGF